jgi:hypothetical protein
MQEATMKAARNKEIYGLEESEYCPECGHVWTVDGSAHFVDCRYFCLDDDRDEEQPVTSWVAGREMVIGERQKAA